MSNFRLCPLPSARFACTLILLGTVISAQASVVITGTRVIYPGDAQGKIVQITNQDPFPNVVQTWIDTNDSASMPETAKAPFWVNPPVARIAPGNGQTLRIIYTGSSLPQDRESLFYLNVLQIPPRNSANFGKNQVLLMLRNRLKLFYRPVALASGSERLPEKLRFSLVQEHGAWRVQVKNLSGYYASFSSATLSVGERRWQLLPSMISPLGQTEWSAAKPSDLPSGKAQLNAQLINDFGARVSIDVALPR